MLKEKPCSVFNVFADAIMTIMRQQGFTTAVLTIRIRKTMRIHRSGSKGQNTKPKPEKKPFYFDNSALLKKSVNLKEMSMTWILIRIHFFSSADPYPHQNLKNPKHCTSVTSLPQTLLKLSLISAVEMTHLKSCKFNRL